MPGSLTIPPLEVWAGVESTVNRVGDVYFDQLERNGHATRISDLDLFAELGISAIRYPVLWERTAPNGVANADWSWADERLQRLRELGIRPIVGFVHHGSGPRHTSLVDPTFAAGLAEFAGAFAQRYPWVEHYTPVNEPLTTARFSGLYGHWYPHGRDGLTFARALLTECRAIGLSMQAIREVNPTAQLIQTEDLAKIFSTPLLAYEAEFENERRWLSLDLLCGRLTPDQLTGRYLLKCGIKEAELQVFLDHPCPPDVIGINHYLTSDRFLDERMDRYPTWSHGGNDRHQYADVEAVRVAHLGASGHRILLQEAWDRYGLPLAVTEAHLGCTREEQLRWLKEIWQTAQELRSTGVDVRAMTAWSLLGAYDWNILVTRADGFYEPGVFDLRSPEPRPTAIARMLQALATGHEYHHPVLEQPGWWRRPERMFYPPAPRCSYARVNMVAETKAGQSPATRAKGRPIVITGATGTLGRAFARLCDVRAIPYHLVTRQDMDIADPVSVERVLSQIQPWALVNTAGYVRVDDAEQEPEVCWRENTDGPATLAQLCAQQDVKLLTFSSDLVFDGANSIPYIESSPVAPLNVYGLSKAKAEIRVLETLPSALVVRASAFFGPWDAYNFVTIALRQLAAGQTFVAAEDAIVSPTYIPDLVNTSLDLLIDDEVGVWHLANPSAIAWSELARLSAKLAGVDACRLEARPTQDLGLTAARPSYSVLGSERGVLLPPLEDALGRYLHESKIFS